MEQQQQDIGAKSVEKRAHGLSFERHQQHNRIYLITEGVDYKTGVAYQRYFNRFLNHIKITDLQALLDFSPKVIKEMIIDYMLYLRDKGVKRHSIKTQVFAILHFFEINNDEFNVSMKNLKTHLPPDESTYDDRAYTTEEIAQVLQEGCPDLRSKVAILLLCSTGMRIGGLHSLQIGDLTKIEEHNLYRVQVYARTPDKYLTFCTPECATVIDAYLDYRVRSGEQLKDKSPLIREQFNPDNPFTINAPRFVSERGIEYMITHALKRAGVRKPREVHMSHGFRKFFENQCEDSPMKSVRVDQLMSHDTGTKKHYLRTKEPVLLEAYMQAVDALTIDLKKRLEKENQELKVEGKRNWAQVNAQLKDFNRQIEDMHKLFDKLQEHNLEVGGVSKAGKVVFRRRDKDRHISLNFS
jgi:site-specific recombinase XerD